MNFVIHCQITILCNTPPPLYLQLVFWLNCLKETVTTEFIFVLQIPFLWFVLVPHFVVKQTYDHIILNFNLTSKYQIYFWNITNIGEEYLHFESSLKNNYNVECVKTIKQTNINYNIFFLEIKYSSFKTYQTLSFNNCCYFFALSNY